MSEILPAIIRRVLAGELDQYREIVRLFEADVRRVVAPMIRDRAAVEDLVQDVFFAAYQHLDRYDMSQPFRPWLIGIARNLLRDELKRRTREGARMEVYGHYLAAVGQEPASQAEDFCEALAKCRQSLPRNAETAVQLRYDEGLSLECTAERLNRTQAAAQQLLYRTRCMLRDCIQRRLASGE